MVESTHPAKPRLRLGVSACLLGAPVRFDGGHKRDHFVASLAAEMDLVSVCPEMEIGLGAPRETLRLVRRGPDEPPALVGNRSGHDFGETMRAYAERKAAAIGDWDLDGFIVKKDSPSCGLERVRVYEPSGIPSREGAGLFTAALRVAHPLLPIEEEGRLRDARIRDNFLTRIFAYHRVRLLFRGPWTLADLVGFHSQEKLLLLAHSTAVYQQLGRMVASAKSLPREELSRSYQRLYMSAFSRVPRIEHHVNVLQHIAGYFRSLAPQDERQEIVEAIDDYQRHHAPRAVPLALLRHQARRHGIAYLMGQRYLEPYPKSLMTEERP